MNQVLLALQAGVQVLFVALLLGAGLPAIFALGMKGLAYGQGGTAEVEVGASAHPVGKAIATVCFGVVVIAIGLGITWVVATGMGYKLAFDHFLPMFKK